MPLRSLANPKAFFISFASALFFFAEGTTTTNPPSFAKKPP
jgi:hypothetical protein